MNSWFRMYNEVHSDPKVQLLPPVLFRAWVNLMCLTNVHGGTLPPVSDVAYRLHISETKAAEFIQILIEKDLFEKRSNGEVEPHNWNNRQFKSDVSTERVQRFRNAHRNVTETADETFHETKREKSPHTPLKERNTDSDTEQIQNPQTPKPPKGAFERIWGTYPNRVGKKAAIRHFEASVKTEQDLADIETALINYKHSRESENLHRREPFPWQNGSTWFNNWRDWIEPPANGNGSSLQRPTDEEVEAERFRVWGARK